MTAKRCQHGFAVADCRLCSTPMDCLGVRISRISLDSYVQSLAKEVEDALTAAHARGAAEERATVVAWLRQPDNDFGQAAPAIEAGEHRREGAGPDWQCGHCGDHQQGHPETCWACGQVFHAKEGG